MVGNPLAMYAFNQHREDLPPSWVVAVAEYSEQLNDWQVERQLDGMGCPINYALCDGPEEAIAEARRLNALGCDIAPVQFAVDGRIVDGR